MGLGTAGVLTAVSMGASLAGTGMSIAQAAKQNQLAKSAAADAEKAMAEAKKELEKNYYAQLGIAKEPYELQREALLSSGAQAMLAGAESQRGAAATAGRVLMAQNASQQAVTANMSQDINNINKLIAGEDARLAGARANLDLAEAKGAQQARQDAIAARNRAITSAIGGLSGAAKIGLDQYNKMYVNDKTAAKSNTTSTAAVTSPSTMARTPQYTADANAAAIQQGLDSQAYLKQAYSDPELMIDEGNGAMPSSTLDLQQVYQNVINNGGSQQDAIQAIKDAVSQSENASESDGSFMPSYNPLGMPSSYTVPTYIAAPTLGYQYPFGQ